MTTKLSTAAFGAVFAVFAVLAPVAVGKELARFTAPDQSFTLAVDTLPLAAGKDDGVVLNKMVALTVKITPADPTKIVKYSELTFDARMPAHKHGMVVKPKITETAPGEFKIEGLKLHMAGDWELSFGVKAGETPVRWSLPLTLK